MKLAYAVAAAALAAGAFVALSGAGRPQPAGSPGAGAPGKLVLSDAEWRRRLTPEQYHVLREKGTECALTGAYWNNHERGDYYCAGCGTLLFSSDAKYESGTGWPSFFRPVRPGVVETHEDRSYGMVRTEINCARCGGHLGHVFPDGPKPTGQRYCTNSAAFKFVPASK